MSFSDAEAVDLLAQMIEIQSLCGQEDQLAAMLVDVMAAAGFEACRDEAGNVIGRPHTSHQAATSAEVMILGHMDTVPGWIPVERRDGALYGRGAVDAKGPLATAIVAAARASSRARVQITVVGAVQEEGPSVGARHIARRPAPASLIIAEPSGSDAVVLGYKGSMRFQVAVAVPWSHSAGPQATASERGFAFWNDLVAWCAAQKDGSRPHDVFHSLTPSLLAISSANDGLQDSVTLQVGLRLPPGVQPEALQPQICQLFPDGAFQFDSAEPAVRGDKNTPLVAGFLRAIRSEGKKPRFKVKTGTSDMNVVGPGWGCPMVAYGPGDSRLDHTPDEHLPIDEYLQAIRVLTCVLEEL